jgi:hypothetical protein
MKLVVVMVEGFVVDKDFYSMDKLVELTNKGIMWKEV